MSNRIFIKLTNTNKVYYVKTTEDFIVDFYNQVSEYFKIQKVEDNLWELHINTGKSFEAITSKQVKITIAEILEI